MQYAMKAVLFAVALAGATLVHAQAWPAKPVTIIVPQAAGGANDAVARIIAQKLSENLGQPVVVDNKPGAGGNIGTQLAARAPKDGYTLLLTVNSAHVINPWMYKTPGFDPVKDFDPVSPVAVVPYLLVAHPSFPPNNVKELIDYARSKPGLQYASAGNGTLNHLLMEMLKTQTKVDLTHIPYKAAAASLNDVVGGQVPISWQSMPSSIGMVKAGKVKVIGVATQKRVPALPNVPTVGETLTGFGEEPWYAFFVPAGTPPAIVKRLHEEIVKAVQSPDAKEKLAAQGGEPFTLPPDKFGALVKSDLVRWETIVKQSGARVD
jgi:tripartite-type tricarboxylate transporter receptor subunit TctC